MKAFVVNLFINYYFQLIKGLTISRLALNLYISKYLYLKDQAILLIKKINMFNFIYSGYYRGRTEVYIPYGKNLKYIDVNSLYFYAAL